MSNLLDYKYDCFIGICTQCWASIHLSDLAVSPQCTEDPFVVNDHWETAPGTGCPFCWSDFEDKFRGAPCVGTTPRGMPTNISRTCRNCKDTTTFYPQMSAYCCEHCGLIDQPDWDEEQSLDLMNRFDKEEEYEEELFEPSPFDELGDDNNLCCDKLWQDCVCDEDSVIPEGWEWAKNLPQDLMVRAYEDNAICEECVNYFSPQCMPLRMWLRRMVNTGEYKLQIDGCVFMEPIHDQEASS